MENMRQFGALEQNVCLIKVTMLYNIVSNDICQALDLIFTCTNRIPHTAYRIPHTASTRRSLDSSAYASYRLVISFYRNPPIVVDYSTSDLVPRSAPASLTWKKPETNSSTGGSIN